MRWSRHHAADTPLDELMQEQRDEAGPTATEHEAGSTDTFLDDEDYLPQERRGPGRLTIALVAALVLAVGVLGGVWVQKSLGTTPTAAAFGARQGLGPGAGTGGTGTREYGGAGAGTGGAGAGTGGAATAATPAVVGTVTSAGKRSLVVTDLGGTKHTVTLSATTTVTTTYAHGALEAGDTVAVAGTAGTDGSVAATGITVS